MNMRVWSLLLLAFSSPAFGQEINVRSGAHDGFARVVLDTSSARNWRVEDTQDGARVVIAGHSGGFDTNQVFDRIDRTYIRAVQSTNNSIAFEFACNCVAEAFAQGPNMIVIDVTAKPDTREVTEVDSTLSADLRFVGERTLRFTSGRNQEEQPAPSRRTLQEQTVALEPVETDQAIAGGQTLDGDVGETARLQQAQSKIVERISSAATRGLLRPSRSQIELPIVSNDPQIDVTIFDSSLAEQTSLTVDTPTGGNVRVSSSSDIPFQNDRALTTSTTLGVRCIDPTLVDINAWAPEHSFASEIAELRAGLFTEFDRLDDEVAKRLVRTYIYFGFGAEARQVLHMSGDLAGANAPLLSMSYILEYGHERDADYFEHFVDCDSDVALWAVLAADRLEPSQTINVNAALRALTGLPVHLRSFVAAELSRKLLEYGDEAAASAALRSVERTAEPLSANANLAKANIELAQGQTDLAQERLVQVVSSNAEQSAEALVKFVETQLEANGEIGADVATLVEAYALEMRDDPLGADLRRAHALALAKSNQFEEAFSTLHRIRERANADNDDELRGSLLELLSTNADDVVFLNISFDQTAVSPESIPMTTRMKIAKRLNSLGFARQAEQVVSAGALSPETSEQKILRAELSMALSRPYEAIAHLHGVSGEAADTLRAKSRLAADEFEEASRIYSEIGDAENHTRSAWLSENWASMIEETAEGFGPVSQIARETLDTSADAQGMLARAAAAISQSESTRDTLAAFLKSDALKP
ncbi:hypothetical protein [uncultured Tateyamaria sp.]|uniref:tetratricopeptide repeat protein n=1 Tax=uncultured Tateyamaria sp. TaxID=455651 RepID=UPI002626D9A8|nr:hypothetical protein [uncultured Tateyamaria sp.]